MSVSTIRAKIKTTLEGVSGIGVVNDYRRWFVNWDDIVTNFKSGGRINGWIIEWVSANATWGKIANMLTRTHVFRITGVYSLKDSDASEKTFEDLLESVMDTFDALRTLGGTVMLSEPSRLVSIIEDSFSGVLCHKGELELTLTEDTGVIDP